MLGFPSNPPKMQTLRSQRNTFVDSDHCIDVQPMNSERQKHVAQKIAEKLQSRLWWVKLDELVVAIHLALLAAVQSYSANSEVSFNLYAKKRILFAIQDMPAMRQWLDGEQYFNS